MKRAVTLLELVLVLVLIGILSAIGIYSYHPNYLAQDSHFVLMQLLKAKYQGINYDKRYNFMSSDLNTSIGCIDLRDEEWNKTANRLHYKLHSTIHNISAHTVLCFDRYGRPVFDDNNSTKNPETTKRDILQLIYRGNELNLSILPVSGYVIINR